MRKVNVFKHAHRQVGVEQRRTAAGGWAQQQRPRVTGVGVAQHMGAGVIQAVQHRHEHSGLRVLRD